VATPTHHRLKKELGLWNVYALATGTTLSAGFFLLPGLAVSEAGPAVPLAYLIAAIPMVPAMFSMIELATAMPRAGGAYYFLDRSLGPLMGTIGGFGTWLALVLKTAFALIGMGAYVNLIVSEQNRFSCDIPHTALAVTFALAFSLVNLRGARRAAWFQTLLVNFLLIVLALFLTGVTQIHPVNLAGFLHKGPEAILSTAGLVYISYVGVTNVASVSEEVRDPEKNLPRGVILALTTAVLVYVVGTLLMVGVLGTEAMSDVNHEAHITPVAAAARVIFGEWGAILLSVAAICAFASVANAGILAASRYPLAMSRDHLLPRQFRQLTHTGMPINGVLVTGAVIVLLLLMLDVAVIAKLASAFQLLMFGLLCAAVIIMRESHIESYDPGYHSPFYPWMQLLGIATTLILIIEMGTMPQLFCLGLAASGCLWYRHYAQQRVSRDGAIYHIFERLGRRRYMGLDSELRGIMKEKGLRDEDPFDEIVARARLIEVGADDDFEVVARRAAALLDDRVPETPSHLLDGFLRDNRIGTTPVAAGAALPHLRIAQLEHPELVLARSKTGLPIQVSDAFGEQMLPDQIVYAVFFLASPGGNPGQHLRILAQLAGRVDEEDFMESWLAATNDQQLKETLLREERFISLMLAADQPSGELIGRPLRELKWPPRCLVALVHRRESTFVPTANTTLHAGDRITVIGENDVIRQFYQRYHPALPDV
jgi:amino acid transporter/mannitol/fructose-specific phosphotransferase system IIA component (Ntr-type)